MCKIISSFDYVLFKSRDTLILLNYVVENHVLLTY